MSRLQSASPSRRRLLGLTLAALAMPATAQRPASKRLLVGVEAALMTSGLAGRLRQAIGRDTGLAIEWRAGPGGQLLTLLERGEVEAALTHASEHELALERRNLLHDRRPVARGELVLVGPAPRRAGKKQPASGDPAQVAGGRDAAAALLRIAQAGAQGLAGFVACGEPGGVREQEQALWRSLGPQPLGPWLRTAGAGPTAVLDLARQTQGYALVERGVWLTKGAGSGLAVMVAGDPRLAATYHVMRSFRVNPPGGKLLVSWLAGPGGQRAVRGFGRGYSPAA
jgi:tungstate transport system substrate-binding protein